MTSKNRVSDSVRPLMYGRVAKPRVCGWSTHLKNIPTSSSSVGTGGGTLFFLSMSAMRFTGHPLDSNAVYM